jgi:broad specificity polyphosphatase/5'/3'-nucleotidase SurE
MRNMKKILHERVDPHGKKYFWLTGEFKNFDKAKDSPMYGHCSTIM